jgi:hypothetical protein
MLRRVVPPAFGKILNINPLLSHFLLYENVLDKHGFQEMPFQAISFHFT